MTIEEAQVLKIIAEEKIRAILRGYQAKTGLKVSGIDVVRKNLANGSVTMINVDIKALV